MSDTPVFAKGLRAYVHRDRLSASGEWLTLSDDFVDGINEAAEKRHATLKAERDAYKAALTRIRDFDYRGNPHQSAEIAYRVLLDQLGGR